MDRCEGAGFERCEHKIIDGLVVRRRSNYPYQLYGLCMDCCACWRSNAFAKHCKTNQGKVWKHRETSKTSIGWLARNFCIRQRSSGVLFYKNWQTKCRLNMLNNEKDLFAVVWTFDRESLNRDIHSIWIQQGSCSWQMLAQRDIGRIRGYRRIDNLKHWGIDSCVKILWNKFLCWEFESVCPRSAGNTWHILILFRLWQTSNTRSETFKTHVKYRVRKQIISPSPFPAKP